MKIIGIALIIATLALSMGLIEIDVEIESGRSIRLPHNIHAVDQFEAIECGCF